MAANETDSPEFIDDVTADRRIRMNSEEYGAVLAADVQPTATKSIGRRLAVQTDIDSERTEKETKDF